MIGWKNALSGKSPAELQAAAEIEARVRTQETVTPIQAFEWKGNLFRTERDVQIAKASRKAQELWPCNPFGGPSVSDVLHQPKELEKLIALLKEFDLI